MNNLADYSYYKAVCAGRTIYSSPEYPGSKPPGFRALIDAGYTIEIYGCPRDEGDGPWIRVITLGRLDVLEKLKHKS